MTKDDKNTGNIRTKKALLRKDILAKRRALTEDERAAASAAICRTFLESREYRDASSILLYKAYNNEVDTDPIFERAILDGKTVAYPRSRIVEGEPDLRFYVITAMDQLKEGYKGIPEPDEEGQCEIFEGSADVCITPGVAFDKKCHRVGYGKAFYDRYIRIKKPRAVIGLAYDVQIAGDIETEESDMSVDIVITGTAVYKR